MASPFSNRVTAKPRSAAETAAAQPAGPGADHRDGASARRRGEHQRGLAAGAGVDQAGGQLVVEDVVQAGLVAADAGVDLVGPSGGGLDHELGVGQQGPGHRDQVGLAGREDRLGHLGGVDPVAGADGHGDGCLEPGRRGDPRGPRDLGDDRGDSRLVPADAGVEHGHAVLLEQRRELERLLPRLPVLDQVDERDPVHDREVVADQGAGAAHDLDGKAHPVGRRTAPLVGAVVGPGHQELVDQVALGAHDLDGVVARLLRERHRLGERGRGVGDGLGGEHRRLERRDRGLLVRGADAERVVAVAARVEDLEGDRPALVVDRAGEVAVPHRLHPAGHLRGERLEPAALVGRVAAGDDEPDPAAGALGEVRRQLGQVPGPVLEPGVHRAHDHAVAHRQRPQGDRGEQVGVRRLGHGVPLLCASRYSVSQSTQNSSSRVPPRSTR